jgi:hypothetical protein
VQAPQSPSPQLYFVPVRPKSERKTHKSMRSGDEVRLIFLPLSLNRMIFSIWTPHIQRVFITDLKLPQALFSVKKKKNGVSILITVMPKGKKSAFGNDFAHMKIFNATSLLPFSAALNVIARSVSDEASPRRLLHFVRKCSIQHLCLTLSDSLKRRWK